MPLTVIDNRTKKATICSKRHAAKLVGVDPITILRWSYDSKIHEFNNYTVLFHTEIVKQKPRGCSNKLKSFT